MAKSSKPPAGKASRKKALKKTKRSNFTIGLIMFFIGTLLVLRHTAVFFVAAMLPSIVAAIVDQGNPKYHLRIVGCMNFAGVFPFLAELYRNDNNADAVKEMMLTPSVWATVWIFAGLGWLAWFIAPRIVVTMMNFFSDNKVATLENEQDKLIEEWGDGVRNVSRIIANNPALAAAAFPHSMEEDTTDISPDAS